MDKKQALEELRRLKDLGDEELAHSEADGVLLDLIDDKEIEEAFNEIDKWYA